MNQPWLYMCPPSWNPLPRLSPSHPSGSSQCTSPEHPVSCIEPGLAICFTYDNIRVSMLFSQIILPSPSPTESKRLFYTSVSLLLSLMQGYITIFLNSINYFTVLYWFCHTLTWISHGCTCVPQPEPPSHFPPHPIPQGHPGAPTLSTLSHASNLDWRSISHVIIYMFHCYSLKSSHPRLPPQSPKDCSLHLCLFCCLAQMIFLSHAFCVWNWGKTAWENNNKKKQCVSKGTKERAWPAGEIKGGQLHQGVGEEEGRWDASREVGGQIVRKHAGAQVFPKWSENPPKGWNQ